MQHEEAPRLESSNSESNAPDAETFAPLVDDAIVLTGPTASGKSSVAIALAQQIGGEILSLDSIAVYRGMDIGSAKPSDADRKIVRHHLIDIVDPDEEYSVACYLKAARQIVSEITGRGNQPIFVGGTPMFLKGVLRGFDPGPPADWDFRAAVEADVQQYGIEALRIRLRQVDPVAAHRIEANDIRRMIRALEVARWAGQPLTHRQSQFDRARDASDCLVFALQLPRQQVHARINQRVDDMFDGGLVNEVKDLMNRYGKLSRTAAQGVGYRELIEYFNNGGDLAQVKEQIAAHTRQLARRQETWFRSFTEIRYLPSDDPVDEQSLANQIARDVLAQRPNVRHQLSSGQPRTEINTSSRHQSGQNSRRANDTM